jgi:hypothetical protein
MFRFLNHLILRTPALPYSTKLSKEDLIHLIKDSTVDEAIYLASKSLHRESTKHNWNIHDLQNREEPLLKSIYKYLARMSNRSTPFGIFSGCSVVEWSKNSNLNLSDAFTRRILPDAVLAERLAELITAIKPEPLYKLNNTIYKVGNEYRFISYKLIDNERQYEVSALEQNVVLGRIISTMGSLKFSLNTLVTAFEYNSEDFTKFINTLISCQFILTIDKPAIGYDFFDLTKEIDLTQIELPVLMEFNAVNNDNTGSLVNNYENISSDLQEILQDIPDNPFHVTRFNHLLSNTLSASLQSKISNAAYILNNLSRRESNNRLLKFKEDFIAKFDKEWVPILNALDPDMGTKYGYPNEGATVLTNGLSNYSTYETVKNIYTDLDVQLYDLLTSTLLKGEYTAVITNNFVRHSPYHNYQ